MVSLIVLGSAEIEQLLPMDACIALMSDTLAALDAGRFELPLRCVHRAPTGGVLILMPAFRSDPDGAVGVKVLSITPAEGRPGLDAHQGAVLVLDGRTGALRAVLDPVMLTALRTAAVSAVATRILARPDAARLAIIGTGTQARRHLQAIPLVRAITSAAVAGRTPERARQFVEQMQVACNFPLEAAPNAEVAVRGADVVVTATTSDTPVLERAWLAPGVHVNAVGASEPRQREVDSATVAAASLYTDRRESLEHEAGDYQLALTEGLIDRGHLKGELGALIRGVVAGRRSSDEITLFRSLGVAVEDLAAAQFVLERAQSTGQGVSVAF